MCDLRDHDGSRWNGTAAFEPGDGEVLLHVRDRALEIVADDRNRGAECNAADFDFYCRHDDDGEWEPIELPPPPGKVAVIPVGATIRGVPKDPCYVIPEPRSPGISIRHGLS